MKLWELFQDKLIDAFENSKLLEMAYSRRDAEHKISSLSSPINQHLVKILKWEDTLNKTKHIDDINTWLFEIQRIKLKNNKRPKAENYFQWLFTEPLSDKHELSNLIKQLYQYHTLKVLHSDDEVYFEIQRLYSAICKDLPNGEFFNLTDYLN